MNCTLLKHLKSGGSIVSDSWQACFSPKLSFLEAHPFSEILSRIDTNSSSDFYLSVSLICFYFFCSGGKGVSIDCFFSKLQYKFMVFVQHLAERDLSSLLGLSDIANVLLTKSRQSGSVASAVSSGWLLAMHFQVSQTSRQLGFFNFKTLLCQKAGGGGVEREEQ